MIRADAVLYDGVSGQPHGVIVEVAGGQVMLVSESGAREPLDPALLSRVEQAGGELRLAHGERPGWRLVVAAPVPTELAAVAGGAGERYGRWIDRIGLARAALAFALLAVAVLAAGYTAPGWLAPLVPERWERDLGTALVGDFGDQRCRSIEGERALAALAKRLDTEAPVRLAALDVGIFNAAALPGGNVIVFEGAVERGGDGMDALAGVLAHEIAHVRRRHVTQALIRELGIGALVRLFAGGIGANAEMLVGLSYTRANEAQADADAIAILRRAQIDPRPTAELFRQLARGEGSGTPRALRFLASHPGASERAARFAASFDAAVNYRPALPVNEAKALRAICRANGTSPEPPRQGKPERRRDSAQPTS